jgi:hypothetical protein
MQDCMAMEAFFLCSLTIFDFLIAAHLLCPLAAFGDISRAGIGKDIVRYGIFM